MKGMVDVFTARDLRNNASGLLREAEKGHLSLITRHGHPAALSVPFDASLLEAGVHRHLAVRLYVDQLVTLAQAARLAGRSIEDFLEVLRAASVVVVDYPANELEGEVAAIG